MGVTLEGVNPQSPTLRLNRNASAARFSTNSVSASSPVTITTNSNASLAANDWVRVGGVEEGAQDAQFIIAVATSHLRARGADITVSNQIHQ